MTTTCLKGTSRLIAKYALYVKLNFYCSTHPATLERKGFQVRMCDNLVMNAKQNKDLIHKLMCNLSSLNVQVK
jgi:hypothetical protein